MLDVHSKTSRANLVTAAKLHNYSSETWNACKMSLSSEQSSAAAVFAQPRARARASFQRSFYQPEGPNAAASRGVRDNQLGRVPNRQLEHGSWREAQGALPYSRSHQQAGRQCRCLAREVGLDTVWNVPGRQAFFAGVITVGWPIDCAEFREVAVRCGFDRAGAECIDVRVRSEPIIFILPGPMQVNLDGAYVNEVAVPSRSPFDPIHFTCKSQHRRQV